MRWKWLAAAGGLGVLVALAWRILQQHTFDNRPPIRVKNKELEFILENLVWKKNSSSGKKWKPDHPEGDDVVLFEVTRHNQQEVLVKGKAITFVITVKEQDLIFTVEKEKHWLTGRIEPKLVSPMSLVFGSDQHRLMIRENPPVHIKEVKGDGPSHPFTDTSLSVDLDVRIVS